MDSVVTQSLTFILYLPIVTFISYKYTNKRYMKKYGGVIVRCNNKVLLCKRNAEGHYQVIGRVQQEVLKKGEDH